MTLREFLINRILSSSLIPVGVRWRLYRTVGLDVRKSRIYPGAFLGSGTVSIGKDSFINHNFFLDSSAPVDIGSNVSIGMGVTVVTSSHRIGTQVRRAGDSIASGVSIGNGSWIGANVTILPGVSIGSGCVVGSGSLVTQNLSASGLYMGHPARFVRQLD